jgi:hypothetical protein
MPDKPITTAAEMRVAAAGAVAKLIGRNIRRDEALDAGEGYDLAIDEAQEAIRAEDDHPPPPKARFFNAKRIFPLAARYAMRYR